MVKAIIRNPIELHPLADIAIILRQNGNSITITLDQLHTLTCDLCVMAADMREEFQPPFGGDE